MNTFRTWKVAVLALALVAALGWTATPASSHVKSWGHNWTKHLQPKADKRYYTKALSDARYPTKAQADGRYQARTLAPGASMSGIWGTSADSGTYGAVPIQFPSEVPGTITKQFVTAPTASCPGAGTAAPGHLCVYPAWQLGMTHNTFVDAGPTEHGTILYMNSTSASGNARGSWTVTAPTASSPRSTPRDPSRAPAPFGR